MEKKTKTKVEDKPAETPEPPQIMDPSSASERKEKMQAVEQRKKKQGKPVPKRRSKKTGK